jgi:hypothetical protein
MVAEHVLEQESLVARGPVSREHPPTAAVLRWEESARLKQQNLGQIKEKEMKEDRAAFRCAVQHDEQPFYTISTHRGEFGYYCIYQVFACIWVNADAQKLALRRAVKLALRRPVVLCFSKHVGYNLTIYI